jgi:hypothetical protein
MQKIILLLAFTFSVSAWADACVVETPANSDRLEKIEFPDGREIYMLGYVHGDRELPFKMADLIKTRAAKMTATAIHTEIAALEDDASVALDEEKIDLGQIRNLLQSQPLLTFVGFETEDQYAVSNLENYQKMLTDFRAMVNALDTTSLPAEENLEHIVLGAAGTLRLTDPQLFQSRQIRGFESSNGTSASADATVASEAALEQLRTLAKGDQDFLKNVNGTGLQLDLMYADYSPDQAQGLLAAVQKAPMPEKYRAATLNWVQLKLAEMAADKQREHDVVANLLAANASGILIMGSAHMDGIMSQLQKQCASLSKISMR